jgi:hypothetical protein
MPVPRARFTVRRLMVAVAIIALALGVYCWTTLLRDRAARCRRLAVGYEIDEQLYGDPRIGPPDPAARAVIVRHVAGLRRKYDRAARYPWLPIERDPPDPIEASKWGLEITRDPYETVKAPRQGLLGHPPRF